MARKKPVIPHYDRVEDIPFETPELKAIRKACEELRRMGPLRIW